ncbi:MAG: sensor histidine kinase [Deltaproteobacteria bacterium]|nr:MAG: sensor histidine kinase [Deltaproteobacteria bacterium]
MIRTYEEFVARERETSEASQRRVRWILAATVFAFLVSGRWLGVVAVSPVVILLLTGGYALTNAMLARGGSHRKVSRTRLLLGSTADIVLLSALVEMTGGTQSPLFLLYFFLILANGVRYGREVIFFTFVLTSFAYSIILLFSLLQAVQRPGFEMEGFLLPEIFKMIVLLGVSFYVTLLSGELEEKERSIAAFIRAIDGVKAKGGLQPVELTTHDEIDLLVHAFNRVIGQLQRTLEEKERIARNLHESSRNLEVKVKERTEELERINAELRAANEELQQLDRMKESFMATMSHELRTPLTAVIGYADLILSGVTGEISPQHAEFTEQIKEKAEHLLQIINSILELSKARLGKIELYREATDPAEIVERSIATFQIEARKKQITLEKALEEDLGQIVVDKGKIRQVLDNLVANAVKFTPEGGRIVISARRGLAGEEEGFDFVEVSVQDTGIGIPQDQIERTFDRFFQVDGSSTREYGGAGLGLSIVKTFVELHGGRVFASSVEGEGSTFTFRLPVHPPTGTEVRGCA